jgi:hypothetical protein
VQPDFSNQIHDFNLGIHPFPGGVFWTVFADPEHLTDVDPDDGTARWRLSRDVPDHTSLPDSLANTPAVPGHASFDLRWSGGGRRYSVRDVANRFVLDGATANATITWTARRAGFSFRSDPGPTTLFAAVARERNGVFFN